MDGDIPRHPEHVYGQPNPLVAGLGIVSGGLAVWDCARQHTKQSCVGLDNHTSFRSDRIDLVLREREKITLKESWTWDFARVKSRASKTESELVFGQAARTPGRRA
jgi:hypothetical protein